MTKRDDPNIPYKLGSTVWPGLAKVIEEMNELGTVIGKIQGVGGEETDWVGNKLRAHLMEEVADVMATLHFLVVKNNLDAGAIETRKQGKLVKYERWRARSQ